MAMHGSKQELDFSRRLAEGWPAFCSVAWFAETEEMTYMTAFLFALLILAAVVLWSLFEFYAEVKKQRQFE